MAPLYTASQVNLLIYHYLKESGFHHSCFALRHESRLDEEPLSHEAVIEPGRLLEVLEKGILYMTVEAHVDDDGKERSCSKPVSLIGSSEHVCDGLSTGKDASAEDGAGKASSQPSLNRLTPSPPPEPTVKFVETSVQTSLPRERRSVSRASSVNPSEENGLPNGRRSASTDDRSSKVASSSKSTLDVVPEEDGAVGSTQHDGKRKAAEGSKSSKAEKRVKRDGTPKVNGRSAAPSEEVDEERSTDAGQQARRTEVDSASTNTPSKKNKRGASVVKSSSAGTSNGSSSKTEKGSGGANAYLPPLTGKAKGKQIDSTRIAKLKGHSAEVFVSAWNPAVPGLLASGAGDATVRIWDLSSALNGSGNLSDMDPIAATVCKHLPSTNAKDVSALSWNPDGTLLASGSYDGILRLWTPQGDLHLVMSMHQGPIFAVRWNRRGNFILTSSADGTAIVWDLNSGKVRQQFSSHSDSVLDTDWLTGSMEANPKENVPSAAADSILATCSADNSINILRLGEPKPVKTLKGHADEVNAIRFDPTGTLLASVSDDATARIWNLEAILGSGIIPSSSSPMTNGSGLTSDHAGLKRSSATPRPSGGRGGSADRMDVDDSSSNAGETSGGAANDLLFGHGSGNGGAMGPSGGYCRFVLTGHKKDIFATAWAPHAHGATEPRLLATASFDNTARIWNAEDGTCLRIFEDHTDSVYSVCFSPDRRFLVTGGMDHRLFVSSVETGDIVLAHAAGGGVFDVQWHASRPRRLAIKGSSTDAAGEDSTSGDQSGEVSMKVKEEDKEGTGRTESTSTSDSADAAAGKATGLANGQSHHHHLALSQRDKTLTILDIQDIY